MKINLPAIASVHISGFMEIDCIFISLACSPGRPLEISEVIPNCYMLNVPVKRSKLKCRQ